MKVCLACQSEFESMNWRCPSCGHQPETLDQRLCFAPELAAMNEGFKEDGFAQLAELEAGNFWFRSRNRLLFWAIRRFFSGAKNFLEIGCGTGFVLQGIRRKFPGIQLSGSEIFNTGLSFAEKRLPDVSLYQMDARRIPFHREYDVIGAFDVVEHIDEDEKVLGQMYRAVKPGGGVILTVPQHRFLWSAYDEYGHHKRRYSRKELVNKVRNAGFSVLHTSSFVSILLPLMFLSRFLKKKISDQYDQFSEFRIGAFTNWALEKALSLERALLKTGVSLPLGGSLLLVGRRD
jgi:SAM-dependent methyltransferase